jgi:hypothetical protein
MAVMKAGQPLQRPETLPMNRFAIAAAFALTAALLSLPVQACSLPQKMPTVVEQAAKADHVFVGQLRQLQHDVLHLVVSYEVTVLDTIKGKAAGTLNFYSHTSSAACGFVLADGVYLLGATEQQLNVAKGEAREQHAGEAAKYGAQFGIFGVHERHDSAIQAAAAGRKYLAGAE